MPASDLLATRTMEDHPSQRPFTLPSSPSPRTTTIVDEGDTSQHSPAGLADTSSNTRQAQAQAYRDRILNKQSSFYNSPSNQDGLPSPMAHSTPSTVLNATVSPPRYATRGSLGSVAFSPGKSPGSTATSSRSLYKPSKVAHADRQALPYLSNVHGNDTAQLQSPVSSILLPNSPPSQQQYEYYYSQQTGNTSSSSSQSTSNNDTRQNIEMSPEFHDLEQHLAGIAPTTPNHSSTSDSAFIANEQEGSSASSAPTSMTSSTRKRTLPTPLDLSPPRYTRSREREQHQQQAGNLSASTGAQRRFDDTSGNLASPSTFYHTRPPTHQRPEDISRHANPTSADTSTSSIARQRQDITQHESQSHQSFTGLGLGLPFSHSNTSDSLSSLASSSSVATSSSSGGGAGHNLPHTYAGKILASPLMNMNVDQSSFINDAEPSSSSSLFSSSSNQAGGTNGHSTNARYRSSSDLLSSPENLSPIVDRRGLVGLGELSTPRWTAAIHERRWNHLNDSSNYHPLPNTFEEGPNEEEGDSEPQGPVGGSEVESGEGWEGDVLGGYMDDKENDRYTSYRKSMPAGNVHRSFSDITTSILSGARGAQHRHQSHHQLVSGADSANNALATGQMSTSSSAYSLDALSVPDSTSASNTTTSSPNSGSSSTDEGGAFYTPSLRVNQQGDPLAAYMLTQREGAASSSTAVASAAARGEGHDASRRRARDGDNEEVFKVPKDRHGNEVLDSSTTSTVISPASSRTRPEAGRTASGSASATGSRTSSRSTTSTSVQHPPSLASAKKTSSISTSKEREKENIPSYMRGTAASANKRTSTTSIDDLYRRQDSTSSTFTSPSHGVGEDYISKSGNANKTRHSSPPSQNQQQRQNQTKSAILARTPASNVSARLGGSALYSRQSGHSRQSSITSNSGEKGRKHVPTPINTSRDSLPHPQRSHEGKPPTSAKTSKSPSAIAHHILQQTLQHGVPHESNRPLYEDFDISAYAAVNQATAEALSKLDGTSNASSPRISRAYSASSFKSSHTSGGNESAAADHSTPKKRVSSTGAGSALSRQNSKASTRTTSPHSRPSSSRKSWAARGAPSPGLPLPAPSIPKDQDQQAPFLRRKSEDQHQQALFSPSQTLQPPVKSPLRASAYGASSAPNTVSQPSRKLSLSSSISSPSLPATAAAQNQISDNLARSPQSQSNLSPGVSFSHPLPPAVASRRSSGNRPSSSSGGDVPPTPSLSSKRSSSASLAFGTSTGGSRDSTSATSISAYGSPAQGKISKSRRGSTSSEVSSVHSGVDGPNNRSDRSLGGDSTDAENAHARLIPPVPPLPKDWETYRPSTTGGESSVPTSASASSFKEKEMSKISAMQGLGVADFKPAVGLVSRSSSMEKPAGPRPLRDASSSSLSPAAATSPSLASSPSLPSPATTSGSSSISAAERQHNASKTPTKPKWSLSSALGINKSPTLPSSSSQASSLSSFSNSSLEKSTSYSDLSAANKKVRSARTSYNASQGPSDLSQRKLASVPDIKSLAANDVQSAPEIRLPNLPHSASAHQIGSRARTDSQSSATTANATGRSEGHHGVPLSPGRSLSSLLSSSRKDSGSRQTPSSIPFWSRRPSASHQPAVPPSPRRRGSIVPGDSSVVPSTPSQTEEKTGRRSILGINLFGRSSARKSLTMNNDNMPPSPGLPSQYTASNRASLANKQLRHDDKVSELGVRGSQESKRSSVGARASSLITGRKRGKTLPSSTEPPQKPESVNLPPMQMNALPASTATRLATSSVDDRQPVGSGTPSQKRPLPVPPRMHRPSRVGDSLHGKDPLPTITGSPSVAINTAVEPSDMSGQASKPATPTRIPRLAGNRSNVPSPQFLEPPATPGVDATTNGAENPHRRGSLKPGAGMSSSAPDQNSSFLKTSQDEAGHSSSSSSQEVPPVEMSRDVRQEEQPKRRVLGASASQVPVLSSSRTSGKYQLNASTTAPSEKRRSLILPEKEDSKPARSPLRVNQPATTGKNQVSSTASLTTSSTARLRTKTSETPSLSYKSSSLVEGLPTSRSMGNNIVSKLSIPTRMSKSATTSSLRQSPVPSEPGGRSTSSSRYGTPIGEDEIRGDEEIMEFVQRQRTKQASKGMSEEEIDRLFTFPEPIEPTRSLSPQSALQLYRHEMCEYEHEEILNHKEVFYVGHHGKKKIASKHDSTNNFGYDDERGDYQIIEGDHILYRYEIVDTLGKGSFGQVLRCRDHSTGDMVAVKVIRNKKRFHHQALVEIKVLENLKRWDPEEKNCLLKIGEHFTFRGHLCITTELLGINLYELIKANSFRGFSTTLIRRFTTQILAALTLLRHHRVVHCDLKPENILLKHPAKSAVKVIDFGSSCFENEKVYTYIQSRFYRSPEVILGMNYHMAIDMWSLGCILAELYTGMPIFPGENEASQLACIMEVLGVPDKHIVDRSSRKKLFFDSTGNPRPTVDSKGRRRRPGAKTLQAVLKCDDELFVDFIAKCLTWDPDRRLKPGPALRHPFCTKGRSLASAPIPPRQSTTSTRSLLRSSNISTPRRLEKKPSDATSVYSTPASRHDPAIPSTAPVQRIRTVSAAVPGSVGPAYTSYRSYAK